MSTWNPTERQVSIYNELVKKQQKARARILRRRQEAEDYMGSSRLPSLVLPKSARRIRQGSSRFASSKEFYKRLKELRTLYGEGELSFYKEKYKKAILQAWLDGINEARDQQGKDALKPEGYFGTFSKEQIEDNSDDRKNSLHRYMEAYNKLVRMPISQFMDMYDSGGIPQFKYIYKEMQSKFAGDEANFVEMLDDGLREYRNLKKMSKKPVDINKGSRRQIMAKKYFARNNKK